MSSPINFNATEQAQIVDTLSRTIVSSVTPVSLLESFTLGALCACVPVVSYLLWIKPHSFPRIPFLSVLWFMFTMLVTHGVLSLRQLESNLSGRSMGISLTDDVMWHAIDLSSHFSDLYHIGFSYDEYGIAWSFLLPLVTETALCGFASFMFAVTAYIYFWSTVPQRRSCFSLIIPTMASLMYTFSLVHWVFNVRLFTMRADLAAVTATVPSGLLININLQSGLEIALLVLLSVNVVMSDSIVIWRMCVVWNRARPILVFGSALLVTTLGLNIANIVATARIQLLTPGLIPENDHDKEVIPTYDANYLGLAAAFVSLGSNLCATILVGIKVWLHRRQFSIHFRSDNRRTLVERVMELLVDSGVVYTTIWLLYCISFFRNITLQLNLEQSVTAVDHLDAAMAQITSIYPLAVFILVALDKIHHSRGPRALRTNEWPKERGPAVTVTFEVDVERSTALEPTSAHPMLALSSTNDSPPSVDDTKIAVSGEA